LARVASPYFDIIAHRNGREEYPYAIDEWRRRLRQLNGAKLNYS